MPAPRPITIRLAEKLERRGTCLVWTGATRPLGYGVIGGSRDGKNWYDSPHRIAYMLAFGPIPEGLHIDHLCGERLCCEPSHLEAVTQAENNRRANAARKARGGYAA